MATIRIWLCIVVLLVARTASGQAEVARWMAAYALPENAAPTALAQTADGFLWVGSSAGLLRFDGIDWLPLPLPDPAGEAVTDLLVDPDDRLWIATDSSLYLRQGDRTERIAHLDPEAARIHRLRWLDGELLLGTRNGVYRQDPANGLVHLPGLEQKTVFDLASDPAGHGLLAATTDGLYRQDASAWARLHGNDEQDLVTSLARDDRGTLWLGGFRIRVWDGETGSEEVTAPAELIRHLAFLSNGALWVGTHSDGLHIRSPDGAWRRGDRRLRGEHITAVLEDREHGIWIGTLGAGLQRFILTGMEAIEFEDGLPTKLLSDVAAGANGDLWIASYGQGLVRLDRDRAVQHVATPCGDTLLGLLRTSPDALWVAGEGGLCRLGAGGVAERVDPDPALALAPARAGGIWVLHEDRLQRRNHGRIERDYRRGQEAGNPYVTGLLDAGDDGAWLGGSHGLQHVGPEGWRTVDANGAVQAMLEVDPEHLWLLQAGQLVLRGRDGSRWQNAALPSAWLLWRGDNGALWQLGPAGSARVPESQLRAHLEAGEPAPTPEVFDAVAGLDGAQDPEIGLRRMVELGDGRVAFVAYGQVRIGHLAPAQPVDFPHTTRINRVSAPGVEDAVNGQIFEPGQKPIRIDYTVASLRDPRAARFRYRLLPLAEDWSTPVRDRQQSYAQLPPGSYRFEVEAQIPGTTTLPIQFDFTVRPRWPETWWARLLGVALALSGAGYAALLMLRWRVRRMTQHQRELRSLVAARTRELELANQQLTQLARTDPLTGLANRRVFMEALREQWNSASGTGSPLAALMIDVDHFKAYNDRYGHGAGDLALQQIAAALASVTARPSDLVARYGGEEFLVVLPGTGQEEALAIAEAMRAAVARLGIAHGGRSDPVIVTISIGVAVSPAGEDTMERLLAQADDALYRAKQAGRNCVAGG